MAESERNGGVLVEFQPMSPEEMQRTMQFLLNQQARFDADSARREIFIERLGVKVDQVTTSIGRLDAKVEEVTSAVLGLTSIVGHVVDSVNQLATAQQRTAEHLQETNRQVQETNRQVEETDRRLRDVAGLIERHLRDDHGYGPS